MLADNDSMSSIGYSCARSSPDAAARLPIMLRVGDRPCVVVGGGRVALRKATSLLAAGACVTVVSPDVTPDLARLVAGGRLRHRARRFAPADVRGAFLAIAATDDAAVNRLVLEACRRHGVLCAATDAQWESADFISPAVAADQELTVTVSTNGRACRRAKQIKEVLQRHLDLLGACDLAVVTARWRAGATPDGAACTAEITARLRQLWGVHEYMVVIDADGVTVLATVCAAPTVGPLLQALLPRAVCRSRFTYGAAALRLAVERWAADEAKACARAAARAQRDGVAGERMQRWIALTRRLARRIRTGRAVSLTPQQYRKEYEQLVANDTSRNTVE